jgi:tripartite-type tricarboxylate transporter receptor subunit TctC
MTLARRRFGLAANAAAAPLLVTAAKAQTWPSRPIGMVVPASAGGPIDPIGRKGEWP